MECETIVMDEKKKAQLKSLIDAAGLVSFDIFDTLLYRKTNTPEIIFDLVGKHFGIHGFRKMRMNAQDEASRRTYAANGYPHADMNEIYGVLSERTEIPVDWKEVKNFEIQIEGDALVANREMLEIFRYAKETGKRVVATSDMYLLADTLRGYLERNGFEGFDYIYCSADEHKAKFNKELFAEVARRENISCEQILHIGDKQRDDVDFPASFGMQTFLVEADADMGKVKDVGGSDVDKGIYKILCDEKKGFWYNLGAEVGGPIYLALYRYLREKAGDRKIWFLARDGYNLYHILKSMGYENVEYLYVSRRALTLAAITRMDEWDIATLPPYTFGQTVGEILDYLCVDRGQITHLEDAGFRSFEDVIRTEADQAAFRKLYVYDREVFLARCDLERENARRYLDSVGFLDSDAICFDCGWQGSSQDLLERTKQALGCEKHHDFLYFGIKNGAKSQKQLRNMHYDAYLFDFWRNFDLQGDLHQNVVLYELFFSAPHESVYYYDENGQVVFEEGPGSPEKEELLAGIRDFMAEGLPFIRKYDIEYTPQLAAGHLKRLIHMPTEEEAVTIGDLQNVDGFARKQGEAKYIASVTREQLDKNPNLEIYWPKGLLKRPDVPEDVKLECARRYGLQYPQVIPEYHLEDEGSIRNYHRWIRYQQEHPVEIRELAYKPRFSVVIPVYNTVTSQLTECIDSVLAQNYDNYELILVDDHSTWDNVRPVLQGYEADEKVRVIYRPVNGHISAATNDGIAQADGDFIVFMDCDDTIEPNALYEFAFKLNENPELDFIYSDDDKLTEDGKIRHMPFFKPDWSPDLFLSMMYTNHLATYRTSIVRAVGGLRTAYNGSQDYDFTLRFMERSENSRVGHVAKVLYHWRERKESVAYNMGSKNYASEAARYAKEDYIRRNKIPAHLEYIDGMSQYRIVYEVVGAPLVSIVIPSKDHPGILMQCIRSIRDFTDYSNYEIVVVDNGSSKENRKTIEAFLKPLGAKYIYEKEDFNFSKMCNRGADHAEGSYLLFLNDDIEIFRPQWLRRMLGQAQQDHVGAVGAKLYYPQSTVLQHSGVSNPVDGPLHSFMTLDDRNPYYFGLNWVDTDCIGVTGACLMLKKEKFLEAGRFDEALPVAYNDVKLCFQLHELGYYNVIRNDVVAYHHESLSRGSDQLDDSKLIRMNKERTALFARFPSLKDRDPYLNPNLAKLHAGLSLVHDCETLRAMAMDGYTDISNAVVDSVEVGEKIRVVGWSVLQQAQEEKRFLVFRDPFGNVWGTPVLPMHRADVAAHFADQRYAWAGFECVLQKTDLPVDILPFEIGVLTWDVTGAGYICWCGQTPVIRNPKPRPAALPHKTLADFCLRDGSNRVQWYLDSCQENPGYHHVRGFAFKRGDDHYCYSKSLVLRSEDDVQEFAIWPDERLDVAYAFPREHFLYYTGFIGYIYHDALQKGRSYDVIIRLRNRMAPEDILDIPTAGRISL